jgi:hypothetical protein
VQGEGDIADQGEGPVPLNVVAKGRLVLRYDRAVVFEARRSGALEPSHVRATRWRTEPKTLLANASRTSYSRRVTSSASPQASVRAAESLTVAAASLGSPRKSCGNARSSPPPAQAIGRRVDWSRGRSGRRGHQSGQ